jgi:hypothetical protein
MQLTPTQVQEFAAVLGSAPVLTTENEEHYNEIWQHLIACYGPADFLQLFLIKQVQNETWKMIRYTRHQSLGIDRRFRQSLQYQAKRLQEQKARQGEAAERAGRPTTDLNRLTELQDAVFNVAEDVDGIFDHATKENEHNKALEAGIDFEERLDKLISSALKRRNDAIEQLALYRIGLGRQWRRVSDEIIEAEATEIEPSKRIEAPGENA